MTFIFALTLSVAAASVEESTVINFDTVPVAAEIVKPSLTLIHGRKAAQFERGSLIRQLLIEPQFRDTRVDPDEQLPVVEGEPKS